ALPVVVNIVEVEGEQLGPPTGGIDEGRDDRAHQSLTVRVLDASAGVAHSDDLLGGRAVPSRGIHPGCLDRLSRAVLQLFHGDEPVAERPDRREVSAARPGAARIAEVIDKSLRAFSGEIRDERLGSERAKECAALAGVAHDGGRVAGLEFGVRELLKELRQHCLCSVRAYYLRVDKKKTFRLK